MSKYDCKLSEKLHQKGADEECGSVQENGWHGLFREDKAILHEDTQGFVTVDSYDSDEDMEEAWASIQDDQDEFEGDDEEAEEE